ncbi:MAG: hypothetical protein P4N60_06595 [Verrucomicrobiae bacterium]|nr:hypothetical protein [Verrucomicrobiae bacterium]
MKLPSATRCPSRCRPPTAAGAILAEACIGLALLVFLWILVSYVTYMSNNRIRTVMAARDSAWLSGNGQNPTAQGSIAGSFFSGDDVNVAQVQSSVRVPLSPGNPYFTPAVCSNSVTFGMSVSDLKQSTQFPFVLMNMQVPFMPEAMLTNFTSVSGHCAWPADVDNTLSGPQAILLAAEARWMGGIKY